MPPPMKKRKYSKSYSAASKIQRAFRARRFRTRMARRPVRYGKRVYRKRQYNQVPKTEKKLIGLVKVTNALPFASPGVSPSGAIYMKSYVLGTAPTGYASSITSLGGFNPAPGVGADQRIGAYVYFRNTILKIRIQMQFSNNTIPPNQFRMLVVKPRQKNVPAGQFDAPMDTLFMNNVGIAVGPATTGANAMTSFDYNSNLVNRRDWIVYRDYKFILSQPLRTDTDGGYSGYSGKYPVQKEFVINLPHFKNTRMGSANQPMDYDCHYSLWIFADALGGGTGGSVSPNPSTWNVDITGTTVFQDP